MKRREGKEGAKRTGVEGMVWEGSEEQNRTGQSIAGQDKAKERSYVQYSRGLEAQRDEG